jgi:hypothetical protein
MDLPQLTDEDNWLVGCHVHCCDQPNHAPPDSQQNVRTQGWSTLLLHMQRCRSLGRYHARKSAEHAYPLAQVHTLKTRRPCMLRAAAAGPNSSTLRPHASA